MLTECYSRYIGKPFSVVRNMRVFYFLILLFPTLSFGQGKKENLEFALVFGACFKQDSIQVKIQDFSVFSGRIRSSLVSKANLSIAQRGKFVVSFHDGKTKNYKKVKTTPFLKLEFVVNGEWYSYTFDLKNGIYFIIDNCDSSKQKEGFTVRQSKEGFIFI